MPIALSGAGIPPESLSITLIGTGGGSLNSDPSGVHCTGGMCEGFFGNSTPVTLYTVPNGDSVVGAWSGACSGCSGGTCKVTVTGATTCSLVFSFVKPARIGMIEYDSLQAAYDDAADGVSILAREYAFSTGLNCNLLKNVTILGGYNQTYTKQTGFSLFSGKLTIGKGTVAIDRVHVK